MKRIFAVILAAAVAFFCVPSVSADEIDPELIAAAQADGELIVYGSCEEDYLQAACDRFELLYNVRVTYRRLSSAEVQKRIEAENGSPSADVWFGGTTDPYNICAGEGLLEPYEAVNASHLLSPVFRDSEGAWYGIYMGILGFTVNAAKLKALNLEIPRDWPDLLKKEYRNLIWLSNYNTSGTAQLILNTMVRNTAVKKASGICWTWTKTYRFTPVPDPPRPRMSARAAARSPLAFCMTAFPRLWTAAAKTSP